MKGLALLCAALIAGCASALPADNPSAPRPPRSDAQQKLEARALEQAQAKCAGEGKTAEARRVDNATVYDCVAPADAAGNAQAPKP